MRLLLLLVGSLLGGYGLYAARRRIVLALKTGAVVFLALIAVRLLFYLPEVKGYLNGLVWPLAGALLLWLILWKTSTAYYERRQTARRQRVTATPPRSRR